MPGNEQNVGINANGVIKQTTPPQPKPRKIGKQTTDENEILQSTSSASESSSDEERQKESNGANTESIYASIGPNTKSPKKSSGSVSVSRSPSPPPSYQTDDSENSLLGDNKKTNRFLQKVKYTMQKKKVTMPFVGLITACCITSIVLAVKQREFIGFIGSINPVTIFGGVLASCLVLGITWELMQAVRTKEHKITKRDTQEVLGEILDTLKQDEKCIKSLVLKYSNGNRVYFTFHSLPEKAKSNSNIVELTGQPIYYKSKVNSLINDRIWLPILGTVLITGNITFPLALYSTGGLSNIVSSYTNPTIYWPIVAISGTLLLFTLACTIHHWSKLILKIICYYINKMLIVKILMKQLLKL